MRHPKHRQGRRQSGRSWREYGDDPPTDEEGDEDVDMADAEDESRSDPDLDAPVPSRVAAQPTPGRDVRSGPSGERTGGGLGPALVVAGLVLLVLLIVVLWLVMI